MVAVDSMVVADSAGAEQAYFMAAEVDSMAGYRCDRGSVYIRVSGMVSGRASIQDSDPVLIQVFGLVSGMVLTPASGFFMDHQS